MIYCKYYEYYWRMRSFLTPEQILHEENGRKKIRQLYGMSKTGLLGTFIGVGGATFLALKGQDLITKVLVPTLTGYLTTFVTFTYTYRVSVFFQMIIIKLILNFRKTLK